MISLPLIYSLFGIGFVDGLPPTFRLQADIDIYPQNYAITQTADGTTFIGNRQGVLVYDGSRWQRLGLPDQSLARTLAVADDKVFVGGAGVAGFFVENSIGDWVFTDLTRQFSEHSAAKLEDFWRLIATPDGVFFQAVTELFRVDAKSLAVSHWHHPERFGAMAWFDGELLVQWRGHGLKSFDNNRFGEHLMAAELAPHLLSLATRGNKLIGMRSDGQWIAVENQSVTTFECADDMGAATNYAEMIALPTGELALSGTAGALTILSADDCRLLSWSIAADWIASIFYSRSGLILATTNNHEIIAIQWPSDVLTVDERSGVAGLIRTAESHNGKLILGGSSGLFIAHKDVEGSRALSRDGRVPHEVWDLESIGDDLLVATSYDLRRWSDSGVIPVSSEELYPRRLVRSPFDPSLIWLGTRSGLSRFDTSRSDETASVVALGAEVQGIVEHRPGELVVASENGLFWVREANSDNPVALAITEWSASVDLTSIEGQLCVTSPPQNACSRTARFDNWTPFRDLPVTDEYLRHRVAHNDFYAFSFNRVWRRDKTARESTWTRVAIEQLTRGPIQDVIPTQYHGVVIASAGHAILLNDSASSDFPLPQLRISEISVNREKVALPRQFNESNLAFNFADDLELTFVFALPHLLSRETKYRSRLIGSSDDWSPFSAVSHRRIVRIPPGDYRLEVEATSDSMPISNRVSVRFTVRPAWYQQTTVRLMGLTILLLVGVASVRFWTQRRLANLREHNLALDRAVHLRTRQLERVNLKLKRQAQQDGLTGLGNRRSLDKELRERAKRSETAVIMIIDVDFFKQFNDQHGHLAGDDMLRKIASDLTAISYEDDRIFVARYGGEEFVVIASPMELDEGIALAERIRERVAKATSNTTTVSIGVAGCEDTKRSLADLMGAADEALYQAKESGRNTVAAVPLRAAD